MTTPWKITPDWKGQTVAILASGPSMTAEVAHALREHRRIVVNDAHRLAPDADMLVAVEGNWPQEYREFQGMRVTGVQDEDLDALYIGPRWEKVTLAPGHQVEIHNSSLTAIRIAAEMGASKIILAGDEDDAAVIIAIETLKAELADRRVVAEKFTLPARVAVKKDARA